MSISLFHEPASEKGTFHSSGRPLSPLRLRAFLEYREKVFEYVETIFGFSMKFEDGRLPTQTKVLPDFALSYKDNKYARFT